MTPMLLALNERTFRSLRNHRNYRLFFSGQVVSLAGTWMQNVALAWFVVELTHSAVAVGFLAFCRFIPFTIFGLYAGVLADRLDNRRLVIATQAAQMLVSIALAGLALSGVRNVGAVYALALAGGIGLVFDGPGRHALTYQMVGRSELPNAIALNASLFNASRVVGPALAGALIAGVGVGVCFAINAFSFLAVLAGLLLMRPEELVPVERSRETFLRGTRELLGYVRGSAPVRAVLLMVAVISTVGFNFHVILPLLAAKTLHSGPEVFGLLSAAFGGGALVGALLVAALSRASWKVLLAGAAGFSVSLLALATVTTPAPAALLLFVTGAAFTLWSANSNSLLQLTAPDHLRGRVVSLFLFAFAGLAPVGGLLAGWLVDLGGTELAFAVSGATGLAMFAYALRLRPYAPATPATT